MKPTACESSTSRAHRIFPRDRKWFSNSQCIHPWKTRRRCDHFETAVRRRFQFRFEIGHVVVFVAMPLRLAEPDAVNDARVVQFVGNDRVRLAQQRLKQAAVGVEARRIENRVLGAEKSAQLRLQFFVNALRAADETDAGAAVAPFVNRGLGGGATAGCCASQDNYWRKNSAPAGVATRMAVPCGVRMTRSFL